MGKIPGLKLGAPKTNDAPMAMGKPKMGGLGLGLGLDLSKA